MQGKRTLRKVINGLAKVFRRSKPSGVEKRRAHELAILRALGVRGTKNKGRRICAAGLRRKLGDKAVW